MKNQHRSILKAEVAKALKVKPGSLIIDCTLGDAGHTIHFLNKGAKVISIDQDQEAIDRSLTRFVETNSINLCTDPLKFNIKKHDCLIQRSNFANLESIIALQKYKLFDGIFFDLGASTNQLLSHDRGFSFNTDSKLDMRMDQTLNVTARDLLNAFSKKELTNLFKELGNERYASQIAFTIKNNIPNTTKELADLISAIKPKTGKVHPATKVFQSLRMAVNQERYSLKIALPQTINLLKKGGRLVILCFHSGEEMIVTDFLKEVDQKYMKVLTNKPIKPTLLEINKNPRSRSTKMYIAQKI